jgi:predicted phage terminase large subunit-like protein
VEDVQAQNWIIQELVRQYGIPVKAIKLDGDKRARLVSVSTYFENGKVHFTPKCKEVWEQIIAFGSANHDDLVDSTTQLLKFFYLSQFARLSMERPDDM